MRRLSGWARLWIVGTAVFWVFGGWHVVSTTASPRDRMINEDAVCLEHISQAELRALALNPDAGALPPPNLADRQLQVRVRGIELAEACRRELASPRRIAERERMWEAAQQAFWSEVSVRSVQVAIVPILGGLLFWALFQVSRWVWRGFRPPPAN